MKNRLYELKNERAQKIAAAEAALYIKDQAAYDAAIAEARNLGGEIENIQAIEREKERFDNAEDAGKLIAMTQAKQEEDKKTQKTVDEARAGNEYVRAFAQALAKGATPSKSRAMPELAPLFNALTIGGDPTGGQDGGFLVPIDFDNMIREVQREEVQLSRYFARENVNTLSGWRVMDVAPTRGFSKVDEMATIPQDRQPLFEKITYAVEKYALIVPASNELLADNAANLMQYLARWFGRKDVITENLLILSLLTQLTPTAITAGGELKGIKKALNVTLDPAISSRSVIITNQDGFNALDNITETTGKPLMQPDITQPTDYRLKGRQVVVVPNGIMPSTGSAAPVYLGDGMQFLTLFKRKTLEVTSTDIGGNAWSTDSTEVRGITRQDASQFDGEAMIALTLPI